MSLFPSPWVLIVAVFALSGCMPQYYWAKPGGSESELAHDQTECQIFAMQAVPVDQKRIALGGGYRAPIYTDCYGYGSSASCTTTGGGYTPPPTLNYDANNSLRDRAIVLCLEKKGWRLVSDQQVREASQTTSSPMRFEDSDSGQSEYGDSVKFIVVEGGYCNVDDDCVHGLGCQSNTCVPAAKSTNSVMPKSRPLSSRFLSFEGQVCSGATVCAEGLACINQMCVKR